MLLLMLEIGLTIAAWKRGWKGWALLPMVIGFGAAFMTGLFMGAAGASDGEAFGVGVIFDIACIGALVAMVTRPRKTTETTQNFTVNIQPPAPEAEQHASQQP